MTLKQLTVLLGFTATVTGLVISSICIVTGVF